MARLSGSSSATKINGYTAAPASAEDVANHTNVEATRPRQELRDEDIDFDSLRYAGPIRPLPFDSSLQPKGSRSLSSIALQAFLLGLVLAGCLISTIWLAWRQNIIWRLPSFFASLSLFHFLEFWTTAHFNPSMARASSFLLYSNGTAYNIAHALATSEILVSSFLPSYQALFVNGYAIATGIVLLIVGQVVRSVAMAQAGTNFNHTPQKVHKEGHVLVTAGVYQWSRHPSYFGFFWWALGTQVMVGNKICLVGYLLALWNFFHRRIIGE